MTGHPPDRRVRWLIASALLLRLALFGLAARDPARFQVEEDSAEYTRLGLNLAAGHGFSQSTAPPYRPDIRRTPVYPALVALAVLIPCGGLYLAVLAGLGASVVTVVALHRLGRWFHGPSAAWWASWLLAVDLTSAAYSTQILTESLFALLLTISVLLLLDSRLSDRTAAVSAGLLAGVAALCRPIAIFVSAALLPACRWRAPRQRARAALVWAAVVAVSGLPVGIWTARNYRAADVGTFTSLAATNMYLHRAAYVEASLEGRRVEEVRDAWVREFDGRASAWTPRERIDWMNGHGRSLVLAHPLVYGMVALKGIARMLKPDVIVLPQILQADTARTTWRAVMGIAYAQLAIVYTLASYSVLRKLRIVPWSVAVPVAVIGYFVVIGGPEMYPRFRVPLMPFFCLLAGAGLAGDES